MLQFYQGAIRKSEFFNKLLILNRLSSMKMWLSVVAVLPKKPGSNIAPDSETPERERWDEVLLDAGFAAH